VSFYVSPATFFLLHCDEWDRVVALPRHKFVTGATLLQLLLLCKIWYRHPNSEAEMTKFKMLREKIFILWELHSKILVDDKNLL
jgi:hypothetical protein